MLSYGVAFFKACKAIDKTASFLQSLLTNGMSAVRAGLCTCQPQHHRHTDFAETGRILLAKPP